MPASPASIPLPPLTGPVDVPVGDITLSVRSGGSGPTVVLVHGFPDLAFSWRYQVPPLLDAGYHVVAPDLRGFGGSSRPSEVTAYDATSVRHDLVGLLDAMEIDAAVFIGHDWGASSIWSLAFTHPDRVRALVGLSVPYTPAAPVEPTRIMRERLGEEYYMVRWQQPRVPERELSHDVAKTFRDVFCSGTFGTATATGLPGWLSDAELATYVGVFERTGFSGGVNYYRNIDRNWSAQRARDEVSTDIPALFITGSADPLNKVSGLGGMRRVFTRLRESTVEGSGHWLHQQHPHPVNQEILGFLDGLRPDPEHTR